MQSPLSLKLPFAQLSPESFAAPSAEALQHSQKMQTHLNQLIASLGRPLSFYEYMQQVLYAPGLGYYAAGSTKFGSAGDFITASTLTPLFAQTLAQVIAPILAELPASQPKIIFEYGAGTGQLAYDLLVALAMQSAAPTYYYILEPSPDLKARQQLLIANLGQDLARRVVWLDALPTQPICGVVLANEVLDAMPVQVFGYQHDQLFECQVGQSEGQLSLLWGQPTAELKPNAEHLRQLYFAGEDVYCSEFNPMLAPWVRSLSQCLAQGVALIIDYGFPAAEYYHSSRTMGTLMCHYRHHAHTDPLFLPGLQDLTAHVDFTAVAHAAVESGFNLAGYAPQGHFLLEAGLADLIGRNFSQRPSSQNEQAAAQQEISAQQLKQIQAVKMLTMPSEMGELFKVMALTKHFSAPVKGFGHYNQVARL